LTTKGGEDIAFILFSYIIWVMITDVEGKITEIFDPHGLFALDDEIGKCGGEVEAVSAEGVIAEVFPSVGICSLCALLCEERLEANL